MPNLQHFDNQHDWRSNASGYPSPYLKAGVSRRRAR